MPLQNRVTPFGDIVALRGRGTLMGNRGILHDDHRRLIRQAQLKRWIACLLEFKGRHRVVMRPHSYTELFFLDEATAFAAGHRPCAECRREDFKRFQSMWSSLFGAPADADSMDATLNAERLDRGRKRTYRERLAALPDGAFVAVDGRAWLVRRRYLHEWTDAGYASKKRRGQHDKVDVLTPRSIVAIIASGYGPAMHPSLTRPAVRGT